MQLKNRSVLSACIVSAAAVSASGGVVDRGAWTIAQDITIDDLFNLGSAYEGPYAFHSFTDPFVGDFKGTVQDGGDDAYDGAGVIIAGSALRGEPAPFSLSIQRKVDALFSLNVYRWIDTYTNTGDAPITFNVAFWTNLGSDGGEFVAAQDAFRFVSFENGFSEGMTPTDPVIAMMHGNNDWAAEHISLTRFESDDPDFWLDDIMRTFTLTIEPGQSLSLMFADLLAYTPDPEFGFFGSPEDVTHALDRSAALIADPADLFADLERGFADSIVNWTIPSPGTAVVIGALFVATSRRRSRA